MEKPKFTTLDGMRGFAALAVAVLHYGTDIADKHQLFRNGTMTVDLFFVLSGFVIAHAYEPRFAAGMSNMRYILLRLIRFYPMYLAGTLISIATELALIRFGYFKHPMSSATFWSRVMFAISFVPIIWPSVSFYPFNFPAWSLFLELLGNLAHKLAFRRLNTTAILIVMALCFAVAAVAPDYKDTGINSMVCYVSRIGFSFFAGVLTYRFWSRLTFRPRLPPWLFIAALWAAFSFELGPALYLVFPVLIYFGASVEPTGMTRRVFRFFGDASYSIYMLHFPLMHLADFALPKLTKMPLEAFSPWIMAPLLLATILVATIFDKLYDGPLRSWLTLLLRRKAAPVGESAMALAR